MSRRRLIISADETISADESVSAVAGEGKDVVYVCVCWACHGVLGSWGGALVADLEEVI